MPVSLHHMHHMLVSLQNQYSTRLAATGCHTLVVLLGGNQYHPIEWNSRQRWKGASIGRYFLFSGSSNLQWSNGEHCDCGPPGPTHSPRPGSRELELGFLTSGWVGFGFGFGFGFGYWVLVQNPGRSRHFQLLLQLQLNVSKHKKPPSGSQNFWKVHTLSHT